MRRSPFLRFLRWLMGEFPDEKDYEKVNADPIEPPSRDFCAGEIAPESTRTNTMKMSSRVLAGQLVGKTVDEVQDLYSVVVEELDEEQPEATRVLEIGDRIVVSGDLPAVMQFGRMISFE